MALSLDVIDETMDDTYQRVARALADVEPLLPFTTRTMIDGLDAFWRMRAWQDISTWAQQRQAKVLPYIHQWAMGGAALSGEQVFRGHGQMAAIRDWGGRFVVAIPGVQLL